MAISQLTGYAVAKTRDKAKYSRDLAFETNYVFIERDIHPTSHPKI